MKVIRGLMEQLRKGVVPTNFEGTLADVEDTLRDEIRKLVGNYNLYRRNKLELFELLQEEIDEELPNRITDIFGMFAEINQYAQGQRPVFKRRTGKQRAKQFITKVGAAGTYETFRLDNETFDIPCTALGGAAVIDFERYLDGLESIMELYDIIVEGISDRIFEMVQEALLASWDNVGRPAANKVTFSSFDADAMIGLCNTVRAYGMPIIICAPEFAATMTNEITLTDASAKVSSIDLDEIREYGYIGRFRGVPVVVLPQSFTDETNTKKVVNPKVAYVVPAGKEKIVKIAFEGDTIVDDMKNAGDRSMEIQAYKKVGVGIVAPLNNWGICENTGITAEGWENLTD